jgi:hypothetical protein
MSGLQFRHALGVDVKAGDLEFPGKGRSQRKTDVTQTEYTDLLLTGDEVFECWARHEGKS